MSTQRHRIRREVLELQAPDEDAARRIQPELSRIQRQYLEPIIDQCCSELSSPDRLHRIELLEVDVGPIDLRHLDRQLPGCLKSAIRKALEKHIEKQDSEARRRDQHPAETSQLELVAFFAATGTLPWWADYSNPRLIPETLGALLEHAPDRLAELIRTIVRERDQLQRIVLHVNDQTLLGLFRVLVSPSQSSQAILQRTEAILKTWPYIPGPNVTRIRKLFWMTLLRQAGVDATPVTILAVLHRAVGDLQSDVFRRLPADVQAELIGIFGGQIDSGEIAASESRSIPAAAGEADVAPETEAPHIPPQMSPQVSPEMPTAKRPAEFAKSPIRRPRSEGHLDVAFGDADTVYIENSGLVVLWPFLPRFFERLELVEQDAFRNVPAQHRAAGLLQFLVTQDASPPEYQTTLNKILCGLGPGEVLDFGPPASDAESDECATFLASVIANAPILGEMSIDGFRGSFLLRKGLLSSRDGVWLLRVERETYDVILDRFPWSVSWVKFPWMEVPLGVEW